MQDYIKIATQNIDFICGKSAMAQFKKSYNQYYVINIPVRKYLRLAREMMNVATVAQAVRKAALQNQMFITDR